MDEAVLYLIYGLPGQHLSLAPGKAHQHQAVMQRGRAGEGHPQVVVAEALEPAIPLGRAFFLWRINSGRCLEGALIIDSEKFMLSCSPQ